MNKNIIYIILIYPIILNITCQTHPKNQFATSIFLQNPNHMIDFDVLTLKAIFLYNPKNVHS